MLMNSAAGKFSRSYSILTARNGSHYAFIEVRVYTDAFLRCKNRQPRAGPGSQSLRH